MNVKQCSFVESSEVFEGCPLALDAFANSEPACSWGDNDRSLVTPDVIRTAPEDAVSLPDPADDEEPTEEQKQVAIVFGRLDSVGETYIDLEN